MLRAKDAAFLSGESCLAVDAGDRRDVPVGGEPRDADAHRRHQSLHLARGGRRNRVAERPACAAPPVGRTAAAVQRGAETDALRPIRSEEHTSELQSLMRNSYAVFCLKKKNKKHRQKYNT